MAPKVDPLVMGLIKITDEQAGLMSEIKETTIFTASTRNFHPNGLFSTEIFGLQGSDTRLTKFAYIDLQLEHIHPIIYKLLVRARALYGGICNSSKYAIFNNKTKDFEESELDKAETGYTFFVKHLPKIVISRNGSSSREELFNIVNKYRDKLLVRYVPVAPAGVRDYTVDDTGTPKVDAINDIYRKIINVAGFMGSSSINDESSNVMRNSQQENLQELDVYIDTIILGKSKFHNKRVLKRAVHGSTRNVITSLQYDFDRLDEPSMPQVDQTMLGLYQYLKGTELKSIHDITNGFMKKLFPSDQGYMYLTNSKTLLKESVLMDSALYKDYMTYDGLNKQISKLFAKENRSKPMEHEKYIFGILYDTGEDIWLAQSVEELPEGYDKDKIEPLTFFLLAFLSVYETSLKLPASISRYPVLTEGGVYPSFIFLKTHSRTRTVTLHEDGQGERTIGAYPLDKSDYFNSMSVSDMHLKGLEGDFDGDMCSAIPLLSNDSIKEANDVLNSPEFYKGPDAEIYYKPDNFVAMVALRTFTKD